MNKDISKLLESIQSTSGKWYENVNEDIRHFLDAIENLVKQGKNVNANKITDVLEEEYKLSITATSVRTWLKEVKKK